MSNIVTFKALTDSNKLKSIFDAHANAKSSIKKFSDFAEGHKEELQYFVTEAGHHTRDFVKMVFNYKNAIKALDAEYWNRVIGMTEVLQSMPADERNKLTTQIREKKTIEFTPENVLSTIEALMAKRGDFMVDKIDGVFQKMSKTHVTNNPMAFRKRMIMDYMISSNGTSGHKYYHVNHGNSGNIDDLREVISQIRGVDTKARFGTYSDLTRIVDAKLFGQWHVFDGGAFAIRIYKIGTAHIEVHPDIALKLNEILAAKYPNCIAGTHKKKGKEFNYNPSWATELRNDVLTQTIIDKLKDAHRTLQHNQTCYMSDTYDKFTDQDRADVEKVMTFLGGEKTRGDGWFFGHDIQEALEKIILTGVIPNKKSYQFYPTKPELAKTVISMADIEMRHMVLEPSAGQGGIADFCPNQKMVTCIDVSESNCEILKGKGYRFIEKKDFLSIDPDHSHKFDRVVMNPPFHSNQAIKHVLHAANFLRDEGVLVAVMPSTYLNRDRLFNETNCHVEWSEIFEEQFDGTNVSVVILKLTGKGCL